MSKKNKTITDLDLFVQDYYNALESYQCCKSAFNYAEPEYISIAIEQLRAAELNLDVQYKKAKLLNIELPIRIEYYRNGY